VMSSLLRFAGTPASAAAVWFATYSNNWWDGFPTAICSISISLWQVLSL
jgi:hypothetical protein